MLKKNMLYGSSVQRYTEGNYGIFHPIQEVVVVDLGFFTEDSGYYLTPPALDYVMGEICTETQLQRLEVDAVQQTLRPESSISATRLSLTCCFY